MLIWSHLCCLSFPCHRNVAGNSALILELEFHGRIPNPLTLSSGMRKLFKSWGSVVRLLLSIKDEADQRVSKPSRVRGPSRFGRMLWFPVIRSIYPVAVDPVVSTVIVEG